MVEQDSDPATSLRPATPRWVKLLGTAVVVLILLVGGVMVLSGGNHGPGMHAPSGQTSSNTVSANEGGVGGPAEAEDSTRKVGVATLDAMAYEPTAINVSVGETVTFVVTNDGTTTHEFTLGDSEMQQQHAAAMAHMPDGMAHELPNSIAVQPGETRELTWRFGGTGTLEYGCHEPGHYDAGMRGQISVS